MARTDAVVARLDVRVTHAEHSGPLQNDQAIVDALLTQLDGVSIEVQDRTNTEGAIYEITVAAAELARKELRERVELQLGVRPA